MANHPPLIRACIFDMDGLLLNTEDQITTCINRILTQYSKPPLSWSFKAKVQGRSAAEADTLFHEWARLPIPRHEYSRQLGELLREVFPHAQPLPGVEVLLDDLRRARTVDGGGGPVELALGTSTVTERFELKTRHQKALFQAFPLECRVLGDDPRVEKHKPAPDVYLCALECTNQRLRGRKTPYQIEARECLVFEDAILGAEAGLAAGMQVVWCPHPDLLQEICKGEDSDLCAEVARVFGLKRGDSIKGVSSDELSRRIGDGTEGRARLLTTLERFPYHLYGIEIEEKTTPAQL